MGFSQAERFEQHVNNQLSKWVGASPMLFPICQRLGLAQIVDAHRPGKEEISHGKVVTALTSNRLLSPRPLYKVGEWMGGTILEDALEVDAEQMYDRRLGRTPDDIQALNAREAPPSHPSGSAQPLLYSTALGLVKVYGTAKSTNNGQISLYHVSRALRKAK